ncbi:MAG: hypothetical protein FWH33_04050 [Oscillospiraceae bacterium]|nr:hypothetical protein [Oscillospiraceae bacterium]
MIILGLIIGLVSGAAQTWMLTKFTKAATNGEFGKRTIIFGLCQFLLPLAVLLCCAFLISETLIWAAVGMVVILVGFSLVRFLTSKKA